MTGQASISLGRETYRKALEAASMSRVGAYLDEGKTHYYSATEIGLVSGSE